MRDIFAISRQSAEHHSPVLYQSREGPAEQSITPKASPFSSSQTTPLASPIVASFLCYGRNDSSPEYGLTSSFNGSSNNNFSICSMCEECQRDKLNKFDSTDSETTPVSLSPVRSLSPLDNEKYTTHCCNYSRTCSVLPACGGNIALRKTNGNSYGNFNRLTTIEPLKPLKPLEPLGAIGSSKQMSRQTSLNHLTCIAADSDASFVEFAKCSNNKSRYTMDDSFYKTSRKTITGKSGGKNFNFTFDLVDSSLPHNLCSKEKICKIEEAKSSISIANFAKRLAKMFGVGFAGVLGLAMGIGFFSAIVYPVWLLLRHISLQMSEEEAIQRMAISGCMKNYEANRCATVHAPAIKKNCDSWKLCMEKQAVTANWIPIVVRTVMQGLDEGFHGLSHRSIIILVGVMTILLILYSRLPIRFL